MSEGKSRGSWHPFQAQPLSCCRLESCRYVASYWEERISFTLFFGSRRTKSGGFLGVIFSTHSCPFYVVQVWLSSFCRLSFSSCPLTVGLPPLVPGRAAEKSHTLSLLLRFTVCLNPCLRELQATVLGNDLQTEECTEPRHCS